MSQSGDKMKFRKQIVTKRLCLMVTTIDAKDTFFE